MSSLLQGKLQAKLGSQASKQYFTKIFFFQNVLCLLCILNVDKDIED